MPVVSQEAAKPFVLVADDDPDMRQEVAKSLSDAGYDTMALDGGEHLLEYMGKCAVYGGSFRTPDVIVSDIRMPGCSGLEMLRTIREVGWLTTPIILMTAFGDAATHEEARRLGAVATFDKPFDAEDLLAAVKWARSLSC